MGNRKSATTKTYVDALYDLFGPSVSFRIVEVFQGNCRYILRKFLPAQLAELLLG